MIPAVLLCAVSVLLIGCNWWILIRSRMGAYGERHVSMFPVIGGLFGFLGMASLGGGWVAWSWIPPVIDLGCLPAIVGALWHVATHRDE